MIRSLLPLLLAAPLAVAAPVPKELRKAALPLDGKWKVTAYESNGRPVNSTVILGQMWAFRGGELAITRTTAVKGAAGLPPNKVGVRADAKTGEFDYVFATGTVRLGRYEIRGDTLTVCLSLSTGPMSERPANLDGGQGTLRYTFKRADADDTK